MDLQNQQRVKEATDKYGAETILVILGAGDAEGAEIAAETVSAGDPTYAGPLAGVPLGLAVYHIYDQAVKAEIDPALWEEHLSMMEMVVDTQKLAAAVTGIREQYSKHRL